MLLFCDTHLEFFKDNFITFDVAMYITIIIRTLFTSAVSIIIFKRNQFQCMTWMSKLAFIGFILMVFLGTFEPIYYYNYGKEEPFLESLLNFIFLENHWLFAYHYLRIACMFRLLVVRHSEGELKLMQ